MIGDINVVVSSCQSDGAALPADRSQQQNGNLIITNLRKTDHGAYDCVLENEVATLVATATLLIESEFGRRRIPEFVS